MRCSHFLYNEPIHHTVARALSQRFSDEQFERTFRDSVRHLL